MILSPEEYLSNTAFDAPLSFDREPLTSGERAFVEKYLGLDILEKEPEKKYSLPVKTLDKPKIIEIVQPAVQKRVSPVILPVKSQPVIEVRVPEKQIIITEKVECQTPEEIITPAVIKEDIKEEIAEAITASVTEAEATPMTESISIAKATPITLREKLRNMDEIQMVSFFIAQQTFLLPVAAIQEVIRHMELVKVPQAPYFVAGAINLRGHIIPLVHLSALLTSEKTHFYSDRNFIIVCGNEHLQLGLIIDRISGMHILPQKKLIWNAESKIGDSAEFLYAIADLNDKVCGVVDPEIIAQHILTH